MRSSTLLSTPLALTFGLVAFAATSPASAQSYTVQTGSLPFQSIAGTGTPIAVPVADDDYGTFTLPFAFQFFGQSVPAGTSLYVTTNGLLAIGSPDTAYNNVSIPSSATPNRFIAPFWDDQTFEYGATAHYLVSGNTAVIEWTAVASLDFTTESVSYQVAIDSVSNSIAVSFGPRTGGTGWSGTVGLEDASGVNGASLPCSPSCTLSDVPNGQGVVFMPSANPPMQADLIPYLLSSVPSQVTAGMQVSFDYEVINDGAGPAGATSLALLASTSNPVTVNDLVVGAASVPGIQAAAAFSDTVSFTVPSVPGRYYLALMADYDGVVSERNETNNLSQLGSIDIVPGGGNEITITTNSLRNGTVGEFYEVALTQVGASSPSWSILSGALPPGLTLDSNGYILGTPTAAMTASFTVECSDIELEPATKALTLTIDGSTTGIRLTQSSLPPATVGAAYSAQLEATGGTAPYAFQVISGAPSWLVVTGNGAVSGTPDAAGTSMMTVSIRDDLGDNAVVPLTIEAVAAGPLALVSSIPTAVVGRPYSAALVSGGRPPYTVTVDAAPPGFAVDAASGLLSGTGTMVGAFTMNVSVSDSDGGSASGAVSLTVDELQILEIVSSDVTVRVNADNNVALMARGGVPPYTWQAQGALQPGLTFDATRGAIVGRPTEVATATISVTITDADFAQATSAVIVRARFVTAAIDGGNRRGGCGCQTGLPAEPGAPWAVWFLLLAGFVARRVVRARRRAEFVRVR